MFSARTNWNLKSNRLSEALAQHRASGKPLLDLSASTQVLSPMTPIPKASFPLAAQSLNIIQRARSRFPRKT